MCVYFEMMDTLQRMISHEDRSELGCRSVESRQQWNLLSSDKDERRRRRVSFRPLDCRANSAGIKAISPYANAGVVSQNKAAAKVHGITSILNKPRDRDSIRTSALISDCITESVGIFFFFIYVYIQFRSR
jgi:hypothetical protein